MEHSGILFHKMDPKEKKAEWQQLGTKGALNGDSRMLGPFDDGWVEGMMGEMDEIPIANLCAQR